MSQNTPIKIQSDDACHILKVNISSNGNLQKLISLLDNKLKYLDTTIKRGTNNSDEIELHYWFDNAQDSLNKIKLLAKNLATTNFKNDEVIPDDWREGIGEHISNLSFDISAGLDDIVSILHGVFKIPYNKIIQCSFDNNYSSLEFNVYHHIR